MHVRLTKLKSTHRQLRTDTVVGECEREPTEGRAFTLVGAPLDPKMDGRLVITSKVKKVRMTAHGNIEFDTENSTYLWELVQ